MSEPEAEIRSISGHDAVESANCRRIGCINEAETTRGPYAYLCDADAERIRRGETITIKRPGDPAPVQIGGRRPVRGPRAVAPAPLLRRAPEPLSARATGETETEAAADEVVKAAQRLRSTAKELDRARARVKPLLAHYEAAKRAYADALDAMPRP